MKVSIIISVYNEADILPVTLPALLNQDYPKELTEIILVNDASTDDTLQMLESSEWKDSIIVINHPENKGRAATRNTGIDAATGEILIFLDSDFEIESDYISRHVEYHKNKNIVGVVSNICTKNINSRDKYHRYIFFGNRGARIAEKNKPIPFNYFILCSTSIKTDAVKQTGDFNENLPSYGIDLEYAYRLGKQFPDNLFYGKDIKVYMHNVKSLSEAINDYSKYGRYNVPIILDQFPELAPYVAADYIRSFDNKLSFKLLFGILLINPVVFQLVKCLLLITPFPLSNILIRYMLAASAAMGYRKYLQSN